MSDKKIANQDIFTWVFVAIIFVVPIVYFVYFNNDSTKVNPVCTSEYVNTNGEEDCYNSSKAAERESEFYQERKAR